MPWLQTRIKNLDKFGSQRFTTRVYPPPEEHLWDVEWEYKYDLGAYIVPQTYADPVLITMFRDMYTLYKTDMYLAASDIRIWSLTDSPPIWPLDPTGSRWPIKLYAFKCYHEEFPMTVPVRIEPGFVLRRRLSRPRACHLQVRVDGKWEMFLPWLKSLPYRELMDKNVRSRGITQRYWWKRNGKKFRLMDLPKELRLNVLQHVLGGKIYPLGVCEEGSMEERVTLGSDDRWGFGPSPYPTDWLTADRKERLTQRTPLFSNTKPNYAIFRVSKQVREEALQAGWVGTRKYFANCSQFERVLTASIPPRDVCSPWLSKMELDLGLHSFLRVFGVEFDPELTYTYSPESPPLIKSISTLKDLQLRFSSPYNDTSSSFSHKYWCNHQSRSSDFPCHRGAVHMILVFAFPLIRHIPRIRLTGCIKSSTKAFWDDIFAREGVEVRSNTGNSVFDWKHAAEEFLGRMMHDLAYCTCPLSCDLRKTPKVLGDKLDFDFDDVYTQDMADYYGQLHWCAQKRFVLFGDNTGLDEFDARRKAKDAAYKAKWEAYEARIEAGEDMTDSDQPTPEEDSNEEDD